MPTIRSSTDLRNHYNEISDFCHQTREPIFITKNGHGDLAVMSIDAFNELAARLELYRSLEESDADFAAGRTLTLEDSMKDIRGVLSGGKI